MGSVSKITCKWLWKKNVSKFDKNFIKNYDADSKKGYILQDYMIYTVIYHFYLKDRKFEKCNKFLCDLFDKNRHIVHTRALNQALNHGLILKIVHRATQYNQKAW